MNIKIQNSPNIKPTTASELFSLMQKIAKKQRTTDHTKEHLWTISFDMAMHILNIEWVNMESFRSRAAEPSEIYSIPLQKKAAYLALVYHHPGMGEPTPSQADIDATDRLLQEGKIHQCSLFEHLMISENSYYSFREQGIIEKLCLSRKFKPKFLDSLRCSYKKWQEEQEDQWINQGKHEGLLEGLRIGLLKGTRMGKKEHALATAKKMILAKKSINEIKGFTMLTQQQVERLKSSTIEKVQGRQKSPPCT